MRGNRSLTKYLQLEITNIFTISFTESDEHSLLQAPKLEILNILTTSVERDIQFLHFSIFTILAILCWNSPDEGAT